MLSLEKTFFKGLATPLATMPLTLAIKGILLTFPVNDTIALCTRKISTVASAVVKTWSPNIDSIEDILVYGIILAPIFEEILFRGTLECNIKHLIPRKGRFYAAKISRIITASLFGIIHAASVERSDDKILKIIATGVLGYFLSKSYEKDGLAGSIEMHIGNNLIALTPLLLYYFNN